MSTFQNQTKKKNIQKHPKAEIHPPAEHLSTQLGRLRASNQKDGASLVREMLLRVMTPPGTLGGEKKVFYEKHLEQRSLLSSVGFWEFFFVIFFLGKCKSIGGGGPSPPFIDDLSKDWEALTRHLREAVSGLSIFEILLVIRSSDRFQLRVKPPSNGVAWHGMPWAPTAIREYQGHQEWVIKSHGMASMCREPLTTATRLRCSIVETCPD